MKMKKVLEKAIAISVAAVMVTAMGGCGTAKDNNDKKTGTATEAQKDSEASTSGLDKDKLVMGLDDTFAPMGFRDENGEIVGYDIDLAKAIADKIGKPIEFQSIDWSMKESELNAGNIDFIWNGYSITDERKEQVAFGTPYLKNRQIIITLADSPINSVEDLKDKVVGAQTGSSAVDAISAFPDIQASFKDGKPVTYESNNDVLMDLEAGRIDAAVADEIIVRYYISKKGPEKYKVLDDDFGDEEYGVGMRKDDTKLVEAFNEAYAALKEDGTLAEISTKWFGEDLSE